MDKTEKKLDDKTEERKPMRKQRTKQKPQERKKQARKQREETEECIININYTRLVQGYNTFGQVEYFPEEDSTYSTIRNEKLRSCCKL